jgi:ribonuclease BN (tRNA processing enzyme)
MRVTVLGKSPAWQDADGACSGYLVQGGGRTVLLDCGPGVFAKLRGHVDHRDVDAVVITHLHADHVLDLVPFASGLRYGPRRAGEETQPRPVLHAPPGAREAFAALGTATAMTADHLELAFELRVYDPAEALRIGGLDVRFQPVPHFIPANAVEFAEGGARFTFSADCAPNQALCDFAAGTDLLVIEATLPEPEATPPRGHMTPAEAGEQGARAGAKRLVLTHFADELDPAWVAAEASRTFGQAAEAAREGATFVLPQ